MIGEGEDRSKRRDWAASLRNRLPTFRSNVFERVEFRRSRTCKKLEDAPSLHDGLRIDGALCIPEERNCRPHRCDDLLFAC